MQANEETEDQKLLRLASSWDGFVGRHRESDGTLPGWKEWSSRHKQRVEMVQVCRGRKQWRKQMRRRQRSDLTLSIVSWNVLSDTWLNFGRVGYEHTPVELKSDWSKRIALLMQWVEDLQPDVLCFQEVDYEKFVENRDTTLKGPFLLTELSKKFGYQGVIQKPKRGKKDDQPCGVATLWKDDQFELIKEKSFSRTHAAGSDKRARQLNSVLSHVAREAPGISFVLAGDFNTGSDNAIFKVLRDHEWHGHAMSSVYEHPRTRKTLPACHATYMQPGSHYSIDHILYTHSSLRMKCVLDALDPQEKQEHVLENGMASGFPTMFCPSDHIPIGVIFEFTPPNLDSDGAARIPLKELMEGRKEELRAQWKALQAQKPTFTKGKPPPEEIEKRRRYASAVKAWKASVPKENTQEIDFIAQLTVMSTTPKEWTIVYHGAAKTFKGRAEFLRLLLEDAGVDYAITGDNMYGPTGIMDCFRGSAQAVAAGDGSTPIPNPVFFPPAIWHRPKKDGEEEEEVIINQVGACVMYIGEQLGYAPQSAKEKALANMITLNALDYIAEGRSSFHPVKNSMSYSDQKEEGDKASKEFTKTRMPIWLAHFEKMVRKHGAKSPVAGGSKVTCADFCLFHVLDATISQFNNDKYDHAWDNQDPKIDLLKEYHAWMKSRPNLVAFFASDRVAPYAGDSMM
ncbi:unnamed protein product [Cylindrotheca closterium]|uniref:GST C-terminal domain-containing protein n=1 Tax=Cylindrotheca closterium TaxID=2856 RepID=A0AAD2FME6_9STRA|nr:unnamed protein product [Cylindrotheca closterium]